MRNIFNLETLALLSIASSFLPNISALPAPSENDVLTQERRSSQPDAELDSQPLIFEHAHQRIYNNAEHSKESIDEEIRLELARRDAEQMDLEKREPVVEVKQSIPKKIIAKRATKTVYYSSTYASNVATATAIHTPAVVTTVVLGTASHSPTSNYIYMKNAPLPSLTADMASRILNPDLALDWPTWNGSGYLNVNATTTPYIRTLNTKPSYSRDQSKGGNINGVNVFAFADSQCYTAPNGSTYGTYTGSVSNSAAMDLGLAPNSGNPVVLQEGVGSYASSNGYLRSFIPWTTAEEEYNNVIFGQGARYAIWPEASFIPLDSTSALSYAPIVYQNDTSSGWTYTFAGTTLSQITVSAGGGGPVANRIAPLLFPKGGIEWGCIGGVRSYGSSGTSGGNVYLLGNTNGGIALARVAASSITNLNAYQYYWPSKGWNSTAPSTSSKAYFVSGGYSSADIFYSPRHLTFIMVFMDIYVDNKIYWQYLKATKPIIPTYAGGDDEDIAQYLTMYSWSGWTLLMNLPAPGQYYTYGAGMHPGYFGQKDITRGGTKMLLTWTAPTGKNGASAATGYAMMSAIATWA